VALDLTDTYPDQVDDADPDRPYGSAVNVTVEFDGTGTPLEKQWINDLWGFLQSLLVAADITPSGTPDTVTASQYQEALHVIIGKRSLAHRAVREWANVELPFQVTRYDVEYPFIAHPRLAAGQDTVFAIGSDADSDLGYVRSFDGGVFDAETLTADTTPGARCVASGADGEFLCGVTGSGAVVSHAALGKTKTSETLPTDAPSALHYARYCTTYLAAGQTGGIYAGTSLALMAAATPFEVADGGIAIATAGVAGGEFADDNSANIVFAAECTVSAVTRFRIFHSADDGATWTTALTCGAGITMINVAWHAAEEVFVALDSDGNFYTSPTGLVWTLVNASTGITAAAGASERHGTLAVAGDCVAKAYNPTLYTTYAAPGVAYSFDLGDSWRTQAFGYGFDFTTEYDVTEDPEPILSLTSANNRFFASDNFRVYRSGVLEFEANTP
jgi:hypothetical protein